MKEKKKQLKKDGKPPNVEEDDPEVVSYILFRETGEYKRCFEKLRIKTGMQVFIRLARVLQILLLTEE